MVFPFGSAAIISAAGAARSQRIGYEKIMHERALKNLEPLVERGVDFYSWHVDTSAEGLPQTSGSFGRIKDFFYRETHFGFLPSHKVVNESDQEFLRSVFAPSFFRARLASYFENKTQIAAQLDGLCLIFNSKGTDKYISTNENWDFFSPSELPVEYLIERPTEVRKHEMTLTFDHFETKLPDRLFQPIKGNELVRIKEYSVSFS
jgi:hypothetical protein